MNQNVECDVCGGTDFYKESGHYYCNECQTQTQELKEHVFQEEIAVVNVKSTRKIQKPKIDKNAKKLTSWEYYNVILSSLTDELITLGANSDLKSIVKCLWMKYLWKLDVFRKDNKPPKLQLVNSKRDAQILYGTKKRKRRKSSSSQSTYSSHISSISRDRSRKKRALAQAHYDVLSQKSSQSTSHLNQTLSSLKDESNDSTNKPKKITYNVYSTRFLKNKNHLSKKHVNKHREDIDHELSCHKFTRDNLKKKFVQDVSNITPTKLYCILYLGLLINKDKMQLGDFLRFVREGHVSFNNFQHFFPENCDTNSLPRDANCSLITSLTIRKTTAALAKFLKVVKYVDIPDILELSKRFCSELNLPDEIHGHVCTLLFKTNPHLTFKKKDTFIPNYEGRIVSIILFILKLSFGFDGATEFEFSNFCNELNELKIVNKNMFDIKSWLEFIAYRDLIIGEYHFPTSFLKDPDNIDSDMFIEYFSKYGKSNENKLSKQLKDYKEVLMLVDEAQGKFTSTTTFLPTFTPFKDYSKIILDSNKEVLHPTILMRDFQNDSLEFLLKPNKYLKILDVKKVENRGANNDIELLEIENKNYARCQEARKDKKTITCELIDRGNEQYLKECLNSDEKPNRKRDVDILLSNWQKGRTKVFERNKKYIEIMSSDVKVPDNFIANSSEYKTHYNPDERYWMMLEQFYLFKMSKEATEELVEKYPNSFQIVFKECLRMIEQSEQELFYEFQMTELYFAFGYNYKRKRGPNVALDVRLKNLVKKCKEEW